MLKVPCGGKQNPLLQQSAWYIARWLRSAHCNISYTHEMAPLRGSSALETSRTFSEAWLLQGAETTSRNWSLRGKLGTNETRDSCGVLIKRLCQKGPLKMWRAIELFWNQKTCLVNNTPGNTPAADIGNQQRMSRVWIVGSREQKRRGTIKYFLGGRVMIYCSL